MVSSDSSATKPTPTRRWRRPLWAAAIAKLVVVVTLPIALWYGLKLPPSPDTSHIEGVNISHRGESAEAPENTLASIRLAKEVGARAVELDVGVTVDHTPALLHDCTIDRTTTGSGVMSKMTLEELQSYEIVTDDPRYKGETIPSLRSALELAVSLDLMIELEIKGDVPSDIIAEELAGLFVELDLFGRAWVASFYPQHLYAIRSREPRIIGALLVHPKPTEYGLVNTLLASALVPEFLGVGIIRPYKDLVDRDYVDKWKARGKVVNIWVMNTENERQRALSLGASYSTDCIAGVCDKWVIEPAVGDKRPTWMCPAEP